MSKYLGSIPRRSLLASAAGLGLMGGVFSNIRVASAQTMTGPPPEVERLAVRVVTDSYQHAFEPSAQVGDVAVQRAPFNAALQKPLPRSLLNEWGLSLHLESARGSETRQMLVDFGWTAVTINNNLEMLGIDPGKLDAMILSHGHYDHFEGMVGFLAAHGKELKPGLPFYLGGEECFCSGEVGPANTPISFGALDRKAIADSGVRVMFA